MIVIKPHHLIDIMKLYGAGVEHFLPDELFEELLETLKKGIHEDEQSKIEEARLL